MHKSIAVVVVAVIVTITFNVQLDTIQVISETIFAENYWVPDCYKI